MKRSDQDAVLGTAAVNAAFSGPEGVVAVADDAGGSAKILMKITSVTAPDAASTDALPPGTEQAVSRRMGDDMLTQAIAMMQSEFGVSYDPAAAELAISSTY